MNTQTKAHFILILLFILLLVSFSSFIIVGLKTKELQKKVLNPLQQTTAQILKSLGEKPKTNRHFSNTVIINTQTSINGSSTDSVNVIRNKTSSQTSQYIYVTPLPPTPNPTLIQWHNDFQKKFDEMSSQNDKSFKDFCTNNPNIPICH